MPNIVLTFECTEMNNKSSLKELSVEKKYMKHNFHTMHLVALTGWPERLTRFCRGSPHHYQTPSWGDCTEHPIAFWHCCQCSRPWESVRHIRKYVSLTLCKNVYSPYKRKLHTKIIHSFNSTIYIATLKVSRFVGFEVQIC